MILENLKFNKNDKWYHGHSGNDKILKFRPPTCKLPLYLANNFDYAAIFSKIQFDASKELYTNTNFKLKSDEDISKSEVYVVTLSSSIKVFNPEKDSFKLDKLYNGSFSILAKSLNYNMNNIGLLPNWIFLSYLSMLKENEDYENISNSEFFDMLDNGELEAGFVDCWYENGEFDKLKFDEFAESYINDDIMSLDIDTIKALFIFLKSYIKLHGKDSIIMPASTYATRLIIYQDIMDITNCNAILASEYISYENIDNKTTALIILAKDALNTLSAKPILLNAIK